MLYIYIYISFKEQLETRSIEGVEHQEIHISDSAIGKVHYRRVMRADGLF